MHLCMHICVWEHVYIYIYIYRCHHHHVALPAQISLTLLRHSSLSSRQVFKATSCIDTELLYIGSSLSSCLCSSMRRGPQMYVVYEFVLTPPEVPRMSGSSKLDSFCDGWQVAVQLLFCGVLPPGFIQYISQHSRVIAVKPFLRTFT